jgi:hypothetical protein
MQRARFRRYRHARLLFWTSSTKITAVGSSSKGQQCRPLPIYSGKTPRTKQTTAQGRPNRDTKRLIRWNTPESLTMAELCFHENMFGVRCAGFARERRPDQHQDCLSVSTWAPPVSYGRPLERFACAAGATQAQLGSRAKSPRSATCCTTATTS